MNKSRLSKTTLLFSILTLALFIAQLIVLITCSSDFKVLAKDISDATAIYETGTFRMCSPMMILFGYLARITGIHPMRLIYSVAPLILIPLYYFVYYLLSKRLTDNNTEKMAMFLFAIALLNTFGYQSDFAIKYSLLAGYFTTESIVVHMLMPLTLYFLLGSKKIQDMCEAYRKKDSDAKTEDDKNTEECLDEWEEEMKKHPVMNSRNIGLALIACMILVGLSVFILNRKINNLHNATQNLQLAMDDKCSMYEFTPGIEGEVEGYLIKLTDGRLVMIDGGDEDNGIELYDFIIAHGDSVAEWYVNKSVELKKSAYYYCVDEKKLKVDKVMTISVDELEKE